MNQAINLEKTSSAGFTLVEMSAVVLISSLLLAAGAGLAKTWWQQANLTTNQTRMTAIQTALSNYITRTGRLPCPSSYIAPSTDPRYGREIVIGCTNPDGTSYAPNGKDTYAATGRSTPVQVPAINPAIVIGSVPTRDLGLPDNFRMDPWGYLYTYAVTESQAQQPVNNNLGVIDVVDGTAPKPNSILPLCFGWNQRRHCPLCSGRPRRGRQGGLL